MVQAGIARKKLFSIALALPEKASSLFTKFLCVVLVSIPHYKCCQYCISVLGFSLKAQP